MRGGSQKEARRLPGTKKKKKCPVAKKRQQKRGRRLKEGCQAEEKPVIECAFGVRQQPTPHKRGKKKESVEKNAISLGGQPRGKVPALQQKKMAPPY